MIGPSPLSTGQELSLYEQIGGAAAVEAAVEEFYRRVLVDPLLQPFFKTTKLAWLKKSQVRFFTTALGGPSIYKGRDMKAAHAALAIEERHFGRVARHLSDTLKALKVPAPLIARVMETAGSLAPDIINTPTPTPKPSSSPMQTSELHPKRATTRSRARGRGAVAADTSGQQQRDLRGQIDAINRSQAVIEFQLDGTILSANENFLTTVGYALEEIQGRHHSLFVEPSYRASAEYRQFWDDRAARRYQS